MQYNIEVEKGISCCTAKAVGGDNRREVPLLDIIGKKTLDRLPHDRIQPVKRLVAEQIIGSRANAKNLNDLKLQNQHADKVAQENYEAALAMAENLKDKKVTVKMKAGEGGRTFGSVSTKEISAAAKEQLGLELDKKKMQLAEPIRSFGVVEVPVKLHTKVTGKLAVHVVEL